MSTYQIDTAHSAAQFKVRHMMIANVKGEFDKVTGTVNFDPANPSASTVEASIDASTISTRDEQRDGHLKSPDFLDVEKYPAITFKSKKVTATGKDSFTVVGDLTIHGTTKEVNLNVEELQSFWRHAGRQGASELGVIVGEQDATEQRYA